MVAPELTPGYCGDHGRPTGLAHEVFSRLCQLRDVSQPREEEEGPDRRGLALLTTFG